MDCYKIFTLNDLKEYGSPQKTYTEDLEKIGQVTYTALVADTLVGVVFRGEILFPYINGKNPIKAKKHAAYIDKDGNFWVGIL